MLDFPFEIRICSKWIYIIYDVQFFLDTFTFYQVIISKQLLLSPVVQEYIVNIKKNLDIIIDFFKVWSSFYSCRPRAEINLKSCFTFICSGFLY